MKYGCRRCKKEVKPKNGELTCCGITELVPVDRRTLPGHCRKCGGRPSGDAVAEFLEYVCYCDEENRCEDPDRDMYE